MFYLNVYIMVETIYRMYMYIMDMCKVVPGFSMNQTDVHPDVHVYIPPRMGVLWWVCGRGEHARKTQKTNANGQEAADRGHWLGDDQQARNAVRGDI